MKILDIKDLSIEFKSKAGMVHAVQNVNLWLNEGEILGVAGESGCGKTTTTLAIPRLLPKNAVITGGEILFNGEDLAAKSEKEMEAIRWKDIAVVFQGAMNALNPLKTIGNQMMEPILLHEEGVSKAEAEARVKELLEQVGIAGHRFNNYPHEFSGGMKQRVMIAMALVCRPKIIIADEPVTALDVMIQAQILELLKKLTKEYKLSMIMISHDLSVLSELCDRMAIMYAGRVVEFGDAKDVFKNPKHEYTDKLIHSLPDISGDRVFTGGIPGYPPSLIEPPAHCPFYDRCERRDDSCLGDFNFTEITPGHWTGCIHHR
ncbi:MAG: ABC transporter ATP-binding protein [Parasporobacterium sp.]|nr:ABC transporter ATP-binding protein [Parasporobacterium sp.]